MANVIQNNQQIKACEEINAMLSEVKTLNMAINGADKSAFVISLGRKQNITVDAAYSERIASILRSQRAKRIKDINTKASKFQIALDADDKKAIGDEALRVNLAAAVETDDNQSVYAGDSRQSGLLETE